MDSSTNTIQNNRLIRNTFYAQVRAYVAASLTSVLGTLIDGMIIGQFLGVDAVSAFGIASPLMVIVALAGAIISVGARSRYVRLMTVGKVSEAQDVFSLACLLSVLFAVGMMIVTLAFVTPLTRLLGATGQAAYLLPRARAYIIGIMVCLPVRNLSWILWIFMPVDNDRGLLLIASTATAVINVILDLLVVFVIHGDTLEMGLATSLGYLCTLLILLLHFRKENTLLRFSFRNLPWKETGSILWQGLPAGLYRLGNTVRGAFLNHALAVIASSAAIAAFSVHRQLDSFLSILPLGMADTVAVLAGMLLSEEDRPGLRRLFNLSLRSVLIATAGITVLGWFLAPLFSMLFIRSDAEALRLAVRAVRSYAVGLPLYGVNAIYMNYLMGIGRERLSSLTGILSNILLPILSAGAMIPLFGADAVWFSFPVTQVLMLVFYTAAVVIMKRKNGAGNDLLGTILLLPEDLAIPEEDRMDCSISSMEEVAELSRTVWSFCDAHGCDERRRYLLSLSVEEMAGNVIEHGFTRDRKAHSVDVRIFKKDENYVLRIRDDCLIFDPIKQLTLCSDSDPSHHMGLRMVINTAKEVNYLCILKLNNLFVKI
ncbi:MAG: ATP-binding protein [Oscillospiraceae bacterium]|nr:ATP-binding protein [Oscillospiraceae bacterium]